MTRPQATKENPRQAAFRAYWESRGYSFAWDELAPESTVTPPSFATRHPVLDAGLGALIIAVAIIVGVAGLLKAGGVW